MKGTIISMIAGAAALATLTSGMSAKVDSYTTEWQGRYDTAYEQVEEYNQEATQAYNGIIAQFNQSIETIKREAGLDLTDFANEIKKVLGNYSMMSNNGIKEYDGINFQDLVNE